VNFVILLLELPAVSLARLFFSPPAFSSLYTNMTDDPLILKATLPLVSLLCQALRHQAISPPKAKEMF